MNEYTFQQLVDFVAQELWGLEGQPNKDTKLYADYGLYGDDAVEFILAYGEHFNVDVSQFMLADYFKAEGDSFIDEMISCFTGNKCSVPKDLSLGDLEKGIIAGKLNDEVLA